MEKIIMTIASGIRKGWVQLNIIRDDNKKQLEENVIFSKPIRFDRVNEGKPKGLSLFTLVDTKPGSRVGEYQAHLSKKYQFYTQWAGRDSIGSESWIKLKVWETGCQQPYVIYYKNLPDTKSRFRTKLPSEYISGAEFEFRKIRYDASQFDILQRRLKRKARIKQLLSE